MMELLRRMVVGIVAVVIIVAAFSAFSILLVLLLVGGSIAYAVMLWRMRKMGWQGSSAAWMQQWMMQRAMRGSSWRASSGRASSEFSAGASAANQERAQQKPPAIEGEFIRVDAAQTTDR